MATAILAYIIYLFIVLVVNAGIFYHFNKYCFPGDITKIVIVFYGVALASVVGGTLFLIGII